MGDIHPILFNTDMVQAILSGRKTVTRRLVKPQPGKDMIHKLGYCVDGDKKDIGKYEFGSSECGGDILFVKPPCRSGDLLYVRETWNICSMDIEDNSITFVYKASVLAEEEAVKTVSVSDAVYEKYGLSMAENNPEWRPSIHMPKEAARIWLKVTDVRAERLQDIDDSGIMADGLEIGCDFENIWNNTVKKPDMPRYGWDANPWVWVIEFKRCEKPGKGEKQGG